MLGTFGSLLLLKTVLDGDEIFKITGSSDVGKEIKKTYFTELHP